MKSILNIGLLLLCIPSLLTIYLWCRSDSQTDDIYSYSPGRMTRFRSSGGGFWFETRPSDASATAKFDWQVYTDRALYPFVAGSDDPWYERCGFLCNTRDYDLLLVAPYWLVLLCNAPVPIWWSWRHVKHAITAPSSA